MNKLQEFIWKVQGFIATIHADIYPKSPHFDAPSELKLILFRKKVIKLDTFKTPMTKEPGILDFEFIFLAFPGVGSFKVHYPENWAELLECAEEGDHGEGRD